MATYLVWWLAFYPGVMTPDSLDQWRQALSRSYSDAHPFTSTIVLLNSLLWLRETPAWASLLQVVAFSACISFILGYALHKKIPKKIVLPIAIFFLVWPVFGIYAVTIWKDIIYSIALLVAALLTFAIILNAKLAGKKYPFILLALTVALAALFRHNGIIYLVLPFLLITLAHKKLWKTSLLASALGIVVFVTVHTGMGHLLRVRPAPLVNEWLRMKTVAAIYHQEHPRLSQQERDIFESFMPASVWKDSYNCYTTHSTAMAFSEYRPLEYEDEVSTNPKTEAAWKRAVITAALKNPKAIVNDKLCIATGVFASEAGFMKFDTAITQRSDLPVVHEASKLDGVKVRLKALLMWTANNDATNFIFWSAIPYALATLIYLGVAIKKRMKATISYCLLLLANPLFIIIVGLAGDFRYVYGMVLGAPLLPIIYILESRSVGRKVRNTSDKA
ncbi:MAG TPA: DUF6020 family protein [Candidatus Saccharimonadales bacterium]|nr:DUF6020 family protein [Candidatus Saccharimonadales bacterium]